MVLFYGLKVNKFSFSPLFKLIYEYTYKKRCLRNIKNSKGVVASGVIYILMEET